MVYCGMYTLAGIMQKRREHWSNKYPAYKQGISTSNHVISGAYQERVFCTVHSADDKYTIH